MEEHPCINVLGGESGLLMQHAADIAEADINPLIVSESGAMAVDARFVLTALTDERVNGLTSERVNG